MRGLRLLATTILLGVSLIAGPLAAAPAPALNAVKARAEKSEVKVWVNTKSSVYHCPGTRWYGGTKQGKYMGECDARKAGYRPAYNKPCGSDCK